MKGSFASRHDGDAAAVRYSSPRPGRRRKTMLHAPACSGLGTKSGHHRVMEVGLRDLFSDAPARLLQSGQEIVQPAVENLFDAVVSEAFVYLPREPLGFVRIGAGHGPADRVQRTLEC